MKTRIDFRLHLVGPAFLALSFLVMAPQSPAQNSAPAPIKWDDYTFKFSPSGQVAQVFDAEGKFVGSIIPMGGELQLVPMPGTDATKLKKSFADWKTFNARSHGGAAATAAQSSNPVCGASTGAYYLADSVWKPMTLADVQHGRGTSISGGLKDIARNPFNSRAGQTNIVMLTNPASHVVVGVHKVTINRISDSVIEVTATDALQPGQYVLAGSVTAAVGTYDFGVQ